MILQVAMVVLLAGANVNADEFNPVLGKVADFVFREADLDRLMASQPPEVQKRFQDDPQQKVNLVRDLLIKKTVVAKARKDGFEKKPEIKEQLSYLIDNFLAQEYLAKIVVANVAVSEDDAKKYYEEHEQEFVIPEQIKVRHILFETTKETSPADREKAKLTADETLQRLKKGEDFAKVAIEVSQDQNSAKKGGELGTITRGKTNSDDFEKAAFQLKQGELSDVVISNYGLHIIKVDQRQESRTARYDEVREFIQKNLKQEMEQKKAQEFIVKASGDSGLEIFPEKITGIKGDAALKPETTPKDAVK
jgi:peptidyl-prolyl cis-trans isomerase C